MIGLKPLGGRRGFLSLAVTCRDALDDDSVSAVILGTDPVCLASGLADPSSVGHSSNIAHVQRNGVNGHPCVSLGNQPSAVYAGAVGWELDRTGSALVRDLAPWRSDSVLMGGACAPVPVLRTLPSCNQAPREAQPQRKGRAEGWRRAQMGATRGSGGEYPVAPWGDAIA